MEYPVRNNNMFAQWNTNPRKREREDEIDEFGTSGFSAHRTKRHIAALPHRTSPKHTRYVPPIFANLPPQPAPPTITPADSDSEETPREPKSFFSPYSSSPSQAIAPSSPRLDSPSSSQSTQMSDAGVYSDDCEMADSVHLSPGSFHNDPSTTITARIPTPIHSSFAPSIRSEKASMIARINRDPSDFADDESIVERFRRGRRLPSPISEGETSPSVIVEGLEDMQMEVEQPEKETPTKKGHNRSKHSIRSWTGFGGELSGNGIGMKRTFTMGYRADCEKCRNKVPGHFSHIITY